MAKKTDAIPLQLIDDLRYDIEVLKKKLSEPDDKINSLILEMDALKQSLHELNDIFRQALQETKEEDIVKNQISAIIKQNETIATGMLALADKVDSLRRPSAPSMSAPPMQQRPPAPMPIPRQGSEPLPPPPMPGKRNMLSSIFG